MKIRFLGFRWALPLASFIYICDLQSNYRCLLIFLMWDTSWYGLQVWLCSVSFFLHKPCCIQYAVAMRWNGLWAGQNCTRSGGSLDERKQAARCTKKIVWSSCLVCCTLSDLCCCGPRRSSGITVSVAWKQKYNLSEGEAEGGCCLEHLFFAVYWQVVAAFQLGWGCTYEKHERYERGAVSFRKFFFTNIET